MARPRILILGNSGSGKTTTARSLAAGLEVAHLDLVAFAKPGVRADLEDGAAAIRAFDLDD